MSDQVGFSLRDGAELAGVKLSELWRHYFALGGNGDELSLAQRLSGDISCEPYEHDLIAHALNEIFMDQGTGTFPVAYLSPLPSQARLPIQSMPTDSGDRRGQARRDAAVARLRSAAAARRAAALHATAAHLMQASGQLQFAKEARARARLAQQRSTATTAA